MDLPLELSQYIQSFLRPTKKQRGRYRLRYHYKHISLHPQSEYSYIFIPNPNIDVYYRIRLHILYSISIELFHKGNQVSVCFLYKWSVLHHPNRTFSIPLSDGMIHSSMTCTDPYPWIHYQMYYANQMTYEYFLTGEQKGFIYK